MRAIAYSRVSTEEQAADGLSLETQKNKLNAYASLYGIEIVSHCVDAGISAKTLQRPALNMALGELSLGNADGLMITKLDRLSRNVGDWTRLIDRYFCERVGKHLWSVNDTVDTTTASGRLVLNIMMSMAQWEREVISERTKEALATLKNKGFRVGRLRYGYDQHMLGDKPVPNPREQLILGEIRNMHRQGMTPSAIAKALRQGDVPTKNDSPNGWCRKTVRGILSRQQEEEGATC